MRSVLMLAIFTGAAVALGWLAASAAETDPGGAQPLRLRGTPLENIEAYLDETVRYGAAHRARR